MAIFNNGGIETKNLKTDSNTTIITAGAKIRGEMELNCSLYIDGDLDGSVISTKEINIGKNGYVHGNIKTLRVIVQGRFDGTIDADITMIKAGGEVKGEIISKELIIESKGIFEGNSTVKRQETEVKPDKKKEN